MPQIANYYQIFMTEICTYFLFMTTRCLSVYT